MNRASDSPAGQALMIQGTGSNVGKSLLVAGLCRLARRNGLSVAPFKPQNMSNNAAVTADGGEIGRAQALQARACGLDPITDMNPVLLKPETDRRAQIVVNGQVRETIAAAEYGRKKAGLLLHVLRSFERLRMANDLVIVEGAGSPAEVNLRDGDIANMGFALAADVPVVLVGDIHRGGVIAQIVGTKAVLDPEDAAKIKGFIVNNFHGDPRLFDDGYRLIAAQTGWSGLGVVPHFPDAARLPAEDAMDIRPTRGSGGIDIACLRLSRIANFDDLDPLAQDPRVCLRMIAPGEALPGNIDLVIIPGTKSTIADLEFLRTQGWDIDLLAHRRRGGHVLGICGGYQILGRVISDPRGVEGSSGSVAGLGLLDVETEMQGSKTVTAVTAYHEPSGLPIEGYEIHIGRTQGTDCARPFAHISGQADGAVSGDGRVCGTYLHGMFTSDAFRTHYLGRFTDEIAETSYWPLVDETLDNLAEHLDRHLDMESLMGIAAAT